MKKKTRLTAAAIAVAITFSSTAAYADWIGDFYSSAGAAVNVTPAQAIQSQSVIGASGGGVTWRVPNRSIQPFQVTPPSVKAGCGGIDLFLGAYSFPNKDEFVQALRNFGQAAVGYFFQLALRTMAPEIAVTLDIISGIAREMNNFSMNSCEYAKKAVGGLAEQWGVNAVKDASGFARKAGAFVDDLAADMHLKTNFKDTLEQKYKQIYNKDRAAVTRDDVKKSKGTGPINVLYYAIVKANTTLDDEEIELLMSLVGPSLIFRDGRDEDGEPSPDAKSYEPTVDFKKLVGINPSGAETYSVYKCTDEECLYPVKYNTNIRSFSARAREAVEAMRMHILYRTGGALTSEHETILKLSSVPLYRVAALSASTGMAASVAMAMRYDMADYAAIDAASRLYHHYLTLVDNMLTAVASEIPQSGQTELAAMRKRIADLKDSTYQELNNFYKTKGDPFAKIDLLDKAERAMYGNLNLMLSANARFGIRN